MEIEKTVIRKRDGKDYFFVNQAAWYDVTKYTMESAEEDYIKTHRNGGWDFIPRFHVEENQ